MDQVKALARMRAGKNVGVRLRATDLVIDVDPRAFDDNDNPFARLKNDFRFARCAVRQDRRRTVRLALLLSQACRNRGRGRSACL